MAEQQRILSQHPTGFWYGERVDPATLDRPLSDRLVISIPGIFDDPRNSGYRSYAAFGESLASELEAEVAHASVYGLYGVRQVCPSKHGPVYRAEWTPKDRFDQIAQTIWRRRPKETVILGFGGGALDAVHAAFALGILDYPVSGVIAIAPHETLDSPNQKMNWSGQVDSIELHNTTPSKYRNDWFKQRLSCVRYANMLDRSSQRTTIHMPASVLHSYQHPFKGILPFADAGPQFQSLGEILEEGWYETPTAFIAPQESWYVPPQQVRDYTKRAKHAPVDYKEVRGTEYDFRAYPGQTDRMTQEVVDIAAQIFTTRTVKTPPPLNSMLATGASVARLQPRETIVLSTARSSDHAEAAIGLAEESGADLAVLASGAADPETIKAEMTRRRVGGIVLGIPRGYKLQQTAGFETETHPMVVERRGDLSLKRTLGALLARFAGRDSVHFLDDDISSISTVDLHRASILLNEHEYDVAGFLANEYPDNSVVCHANRLAGDNRQEVRISGSSLVVNPMRVSFFPHIYNEDWLLFHDAVEARRAVLVGEVEQLKYNPFDKKRAEAEEFGDVLAEGLYRLLALGVSFRDVGEEYWQDIIRRRRNSISDIAARLEVQRSSGNVDKRVPLALDALEASRTQLDLFTPRDFTSYIQGWRRDILRWHERTDNLPRGMTLEEAAGRLCLSVIKR